MGILKYIIRGGIVVGGLAAFLLTALVAFQNKIIYVPVIPGVKREYDGDPQRYGLNYKDLFFEAEDGTKLHAWLLIPFDEQQRTNIPAILFFQENAGNISHRLHFINILMRQVNCYILMLSYRGYGKSEGSPSQSGLELDSKAALQQILKQPKVDNKKILVYGKSLGGAVSIHLAEKNQDKVSAAIIENTFTSIYDMVPQLFPFLGYLFGENKILNFLIWNPWNNVQKLQNIQKTSILMFSSRQDEVIPYWMMDKLKRVCNKQALTDFVEFSYSGHMDTYVREQNKYWQSFRDFIAKIEFDAKK